MPEAPRAAFRFGNETTRFQEGLEIVSGRLIGFSVGDKDEHDDLAVTPPHFASMRRATK
jgi:hypothetical protein